MALNPIGEAGRPVPIILDTDIDTDCDDVGALAVLHTLAQLGEVHILGVICSIPHPATAACVHVINHAYHRPVIPVGLIQGGDLASSARYVTYREHLLNASSHGWRRYNEIIASEFAGVIGPLEPVPDAVRLYRKILSQQPDGSVVIVAIGLLTALQQLMESTPDDISPLPGRELIATKVARLVTMGLGSFPAGKDMFNWAMDRKAAAVVLNRWPATLVVSEWGTNVLTGARLHTLGLDHHPVPRAYEIYLGGKGRNRSSWDQLALLYAVRGAEHNFEEVHGYQVRFDPTTGEHEWRPAEVGQPLHIYLKQVASDTDLAQTIEDLMVYSLRYGGTAS